LIVSRERENELIVDEEEAERRRQIFGKKE
jgi:hypothetical protein